MANIRLKELIEANVDPKLVARSKETGKLVYFKSPENKVAALKAGTHLDPKDKKGDEPKVDAKPNDMFGGDYAKDRGGEAPKADVKSIVKGILKTADKEFKGVHKLKDIADDLNIDDTDGGAGNMLQVRIDKGEDGVYVQTDETEGVIVFNDGTQYKLHHVEDGPIPVTQIGVEDSKNDGQTDDELYDALYDMGYDFGELGSDDFDEDGFADAAMSLGYRYDDKNKVWNHRDTVSDEAPKADTPKVNLPKKASELDDTHAESLEKAINAEVGLNGFVDTDDYTDAIIYTASTGNQPTYTLYFGSNSDYGKPDEFRVTFASTAIDNDPSNIGNTIDKPFKSAKDAMKYMIAVAKKYKKELEMDDDTNESTKLTSMFKK